MPSSDEDVPHSKSRSEHKQANEDISNTEASMVHDPKFGEVPGRPYKSKINYPKNYLNEHVKHIESMYANPIDSMLVGTIESI